MIFLLTFFYALPLACLTGMAGIVAGGSKSQDSMDLGAVIMWGGLALAVTMVLLHVVGLWLYFHGEAPVLTWFLLLSPLPVAAIFGLFLFLSHI